jgi:nickel/cobalt transporter (NicO) family protein
VIAGLQGKHWTLALVPLLFCAAIALEPALAQTQPRNPFAVGGMESRGGAPASGFAGWILAKQSEYTRAMTALALRIKTDPTALMGLLGLAFSYGVFHAAGPGHGKAVVAAYIVANERALKRGVAIAMAAAMLQGIVAILIVGFLTLVMSASARTMNSVVGGIEMLSFAAIVGFGLWLFWRKAKAVLSLWRTGMEPGCDHVHLPGPEIAERAGLREAGTAVFAAGLRPCSGAILILVLAASQGILWAGLLAVVAMSLGTGLATSLLAVMAVFFKSVAISMAAGGMQGPMALVVLRALEALAALAVVAFGLLLLAGYGGWVKGL